MDKTAIKNFSVWARNKLIADITYKAGLLGVTEEGIKNPLPQSTKETEFYDIGTKEPYQIVGEQIKQRNQLTAQIKRKAEELEYKEAYRNVIEEVAYTWFNRLIAIRFMEVNDYMPSHIRVLSSESKTKLEPDLVTSPFDAELEFTSEEEQRILQLKNDNAVNELFQFLFIRQCNALNAYLPKLFENTSDYTELLLNVSVTDQDGIVYHLVHDINENDFNISNNGEDGKPTGQVEIIGWMYQYYNSEPKDEAFALLKNNVKISKERIPAATQLFTPDWIVRYMVENSVGRLWLEGHKDSDLQKEWKYYLEEAEQESDVVEQLEIIRDEYKNIKPEEIKVIDPCMGSGHILVYAFDVLMQIYENYGYSQRDAAKSIVENNIFGLDIDDRAFQLAYFAIMMKARSYNRRFLTLGIEPNLCAIQESNGLKYDHEMGDFLLSEEHRETLQYLIRTFADAKEYGSILEVEKRDYDGFLEAWRHTAEATSENVVMMLWYLEANNVVPTLAKQAKLLSQKYNVVITNPPYMGSSGMNVKLNDFMKKNYSANKADLYAAFMEKCSKMCLLNGFVAMITMQSWMFILSFEMLREEMLEKAVVNLLRIGYNSFPEMNSQVAHACTFVVLNKYLQNYTGRYFDLNTGRVTDDKELVFLERLANKEYFDRKNTEFDKIPGKPIAFSLSRDFLKVFNEKKITDYAQVITGMTTGKNSEFLRLWSEVDYSKTAIGQSNMDDIDIENQYWIPYSKGGDRRNWYGNTDYLVNWSRKSEFNRSKTTLQHLYLRKALTWPFINTDTFSARILPDGYLWDVAGSPCFFDDEETGYYGLGFLCSKVAAKILGVINPTINVQAVDIEKLPLIIDEGKKTEIVELVRENVNIAKQEWDSYEMSWDFKKSPLITGDSKIEDAYYRWSNEREKGFSQSKYNEEKINELFIAIYNVKNDIEPKIDDKNVTLRKADLTKDIKCFISYCVGIMFGRYSMDKEGISYAGGRWNTEIYNKYLPDADNCIPITDEEYFKDDIVTQFVEIVKAIYGEEFLEENLSFIARALSNKQGASRDIIRNYFVTDFFKDHATMYSVTGSGKRPIYWLFESGKQNGFKALIYMHRYNGDTIGNIRVEYLHRMERTYESEIGRMQDIIDNDSNAREVSAATKRKEKLQKQLKECQEYDEKIGHLALSRIEIDLDDGVKTNYEKIQTANDGKKYQILAKI